MRGLALMLMCLVSLGCSACGMLPFGGSTDLPAVAVAPATSAPAQKMAPELGEQGEAVGPDADRDGVADAQDVCPNTEADAQVDSQGCAVRCNMQFSLPFASNEAAIGQARFVRLGRLARLLRQNPGLSAVVSGHSDNIGGKGANEALSRRRAEHVFGILTQQFGVPASQLRVEAHGDATPLVSNETEAGRARNRRVDIAVAGFYQRVEDAMALGRPYQLPFEASATALSEGMQARLDALGRRLQASPDIKAVIDGHSDSSGDPALNMMLSKHRAQAVRDYLTQQWGIQSNRLQASGLGDAQPIASNDTPHGRALNRRVSIRLRSKTAPRAFLAKAKERLLYSQGRADAWRDKTVPHTALQAQAALEFEKDAAEISPELRRKLESIGAILRQREDVRVIVQGYSDDSGNAQKDLAISQQRADAVKRLLLEQFNLDPSRVDAKSYGAESPIAPNGTEAGRQRNRRVVLRIFSAQ